jgi:hypothetical protein
MLFIFTILMLIIFQVSHLILAESELFQLIIKKFIFLKFGY